MACIAIIKFLFVVNNFFICAFFFGSSETVHVYRLRLKAFDKLQSSLSKLVDHVVWGNDLDSIISKLGNLIDTCKKKKKQLVNIFWQRKPVVHTTLIKAISLNLLFRK